jgi:hypothetical protein
MIRGKRYGMTFQVPSISKSVFIVDRTRIMSALNNLLPNLRLQAEGYCTAMKSSKYPC